MEMRYANHPRDVKKYTTEELRTHFLQEIIFKENEVTATYTQNDRMIFGGIYPVTETLTLSLEQEIKSTYFLEGREMGIINIGGSGKVIVDGVSYELSSEDGIYIGKGSKELTFSSSDMQNPAKFYYNSCPAHKEYPIVKIDFKNAKPNALGDELNLNKRVIYQYVHPDVCNSCQLLMGMTKLAPGSSWNTMPAHTHDRRMETYFYFNMDSENVVFHLMGEPKETRHLVVKNEQAVISPSWSIHSGVGTSNYTFIWSMCGENKDFSDMDFIPKKELQ